MLNEIEETVRNALINIAKRGNRASSRISYQDLADQCRLVLNGQRLDMMNIDHRNYLGDILGNISHEEDESDRPILSALVFNEQKGQPGKGFYDLAKELGRQKPMESDLVFWSNELNRIYEFWSKSK